MKILIKVTSATDLLCHEALSLAFALAAFEHEIQLQLGSTMLRFLLNSPTGKLAKMLASLELYDMPPAWLNTQDFLLYKEWQTDEKTRYDWQSQMIESPYAHRENPYQIEYQTFETILEL